MPNKTRAVHDQDTSSGPADRRLSSLVFGDLGSSGRESGRLLAVGAALSLIGPWVVFGDEIVSATRIELTIVSIVFAVHSALAFGLLVWALLRRSGSPHQLDYWILTASVAVSMISATLLTLHVSHFDGLLVLNARTTLRLVTLHFAGIVFGSLRPKKAWFLSAFVAIPIVIAHPVAVATLPSSWDAAQGRDGWLQYSCTLVVVGAVVVTSLLSSYAGEAAHRASQDLLAQLNAQAARSQGLLETAMPSYVARALLSRVPDEELTVSCETASVAFIALSRFDELSALMHPQELMQWLHAVYEALDSLVAAYKGAVVKVETVSNVYLVTSGLPWQSLDGSNHARTLSLFALDALLTIEAVPCAVMRLPLTAKVGIHSGPLTAGLIGRTRRYYRLFGDTVNVASRMMSTGEAGRVQASESTMRLILGLTSTSPSPFRAPGDLVVSPVDRVGMDEVVHVRSRGDTFVKGKGLLSTFWIEAKDAQNRSQSRTYTRTGTSSVPPLASARAGILYYDRVSRDLRGRTETSAAAAITARAGGSGGILKHSASAGKLSGSTGQDNPVTLHAVASLREDPRQPASSRGMSSRALLGVSSFSQLPLDELVSARASPLPPVSGPGTVSGPTPRDVPARLHPVASLRLDPRVPLSSRVVASRAVLGASSCVRLPLDELVSARASPSPPAHSSIPMLRSPMFVDRLPVNGALRTLPGAVSLTDGVTAARLPRSPLSGNSGVFSFMPVVEEPRPGVEVDHYVGVVETELSTVGEAVEVTPHRGDMMTNRGWMATENATPPLQTSAATISVPSPDAKSRLLRETCAGVPGSGTYAESPGAIVAGNGPVIGDNSKPNWRTWLRETVMADIIEVVQSCGWRNALSLQFENNETERQAARELFTHSLRGTTSAMSVWLISFVSVLILESSIPGLSIDHSAVSNALILPLGFTALFGGASVAVQLYWLSNLSDAARLTLQRGMLAGSVLFAAALVWFCVGPGASVLLPLASAACAGVSNDSGASPFEGHILLSLMIVAFMQCVAHMRMRVAHVALIGAVCVTLTLGLATSAITRTSGWPENVVGLGVWSIVISVLSNSITATVAAFSWEARCRTQVLMAAAARAAESDATQHLENLLPPTVVADNKAGRTTKPVLVHDVVILHGDIVGFTALASTLEPLELMSHLNTIYSAFDDVVEQSGLWKLETVGDAYIVAGGLFDPAGSYSTRNRTSDTPAVMSREAALSIRGKLDTAFKVALSMLDVLRGFRERTGLDLHMRVGIHIGAVAHGVIGTSTPRFCILGEATSIAELTQSQGAPDTITCSGAAREAYLASSYSFQLIASVAARSPDGGPGAEIETFAVKLTEPFPSSPMGSSSPGAASAGGASVLGVSGVSLSTIREHRVPSA